MFFNAISYIRVIFSKIIIESTANWIEVNLNRDDEKTKLTQRRLIIDDNNDEKIFTIWVDCADNDNFVIRRRFITDTDNEKFTEKMKWSKSFIINVDLSRRFANKMTMLNFVVKRVLFNDNINIKRILFKNCVKILKRFAIYIFCNCCFSASSSIFSNDAFEENDSLKSIYLICFEFQW